MKSRAPSVSLNFRFYSPKTSHPDWKKLNREAFELAKQIAANAGIKIPLRIKLGARTRRVRAISKTVKNIVRNKYRTARGSHNFIPLFYIWTMTNNCNFTCSYCSNHRGGVYPLLFRQGETKNLSTDRGKKLIHVMRDSSAIYFCGGEPTMRPDLPALLDYSTRKGMFNMINTNGSLIGDLLVKSQYKNFLRQMNVIIVSLDGLSIPSLAKMYKTPEVLAHKVVRNILALRLLQRYYPFKLVVNIVVTREGIEDAFDVLDWCNDLGITFSPISANIDHEPDRELIKNPRYQEFVAKSLERARAGFPMIASPRMLERVLNARDLQCIPKVFYHIDHDGKVFWPCKAFPGAIKVPILTHRNVQEVGAEGTRGIDPTNFHGDGTGQCHGHCAWMQNCVTDTYGRAMMEGIFDSGVLKEIRNLL